MEKAQIGHAVVPLTRVVSTPSDCQARVPVSCSDMESDRELVLAIVLGLRKGLSLCHGMRRQLTEEEQFKVGQQTAAQLKLSNYEIEPGPAALPHGTGWPARGSN